MKRPLLITGVVVGTLLAAAPISGMLMTAHSMNHAFNVLGSSGVGNPQDLSNAIGGVLYSSMLSLVACPLGVILLILSLVFLARKPTPQPPLPPAA